MSTELNSILDKTQVVLDLIKKELEDIVVISEEDFTRIYGNDLENDLYEAIPYKVLIIGDGDGIYTAIDNSTQDCWCEDFTNIHYAIMWLLDQYEVE